MRRLLPRYTSTLVGAGQQASLSSSSKCNPMATTFWVSLVTDPKKDAWTTDNKDFKLKMKDVPNNTPVADFKQLVQAEANEMHGLDIIDLQVFNKDAKEELDDPRAPMSTEKQEPSSKQQDVSLYVLHALRPSNSTSKRGEKDRREEPPDESGHNPHAQEQQESANKRHRKDAIKQKDTAASTTFWVALVTDPKKDTWPTDDHKGFRLYLENVPNDTPVAKFKQLVQAKATPELSHVAAHDLQIFNKDTKEELDDPRAAMSTAKQEPSSTQQDVSLYVLHALRSGRTGSNAVTQPDLRLKELTLSRLITHSVLRALRLKEHIELFVASLRKHDFYDAREFFSRWVRDMPSIPDGSFYDLHNLKDSWGAGEWREKLVDRRKQLTDGLKVGPHGVDSRAPRVLGLHAGRGCGKTHALLDAGKHLNATTEIYITYNLDQDLSFDKEKPRIAVLLRVLMRCFDKSNRACDDALAGHKQLLAGITHLDLNEFLVWYCCRYFCRSSKKDAKAAPHFVVTVDDIHELMAPGSADPTNLQQATYALGELAFGIETNKDNVNMKCTVIVSAPTERTFSAIVDVTGRGIEVLELPLPSMDTRDFIVQQMFPEASEQHKALIAACAGTHPRSIVAACEEVAENPSLDVQGLTKKIRQTVVKHLSEKQKAAIQGYVLDCLRAVCKHTAYGEAVWDAMLNNPEARIFMDSAYRIPPALVCTAFEEDDKMHPVNQLFQACASIDQPKQLERIGYHYDRFRALYELSVVPRGMDVRNRYCGGVIGLAWFEALTFPKGIAEDSNRDENSLFSGTARTKHKLERGKYLLPKAADHPYVDRACLAEHLDGSTCFVLYKDRINDDVKAAVEGLNEAADILSKETGVKAVLCIAQVIGASVDTSSQSQFRHPYVLVRDQDVAEFYTPSFAPALVFVQQRHTLGKRQ